MRRHGLVKLVETLARVAELVDEGAEGPAELLLDEATERWPHEAAPWRWRGELRARRQAWDEARADYRQVMRLAPSAPAACGLATTLEVQGRLAEAMAVLEQAREAVPGDAEVHFRLGSLHADQGSIAEAQAAYREAIERDPTHLAAWFNLGGHALVEGAHADAITIYEEVLALDPSHVDARYNLGFALQRRGLATGVEAQVTRAHACFEAVVRADPDHVQGWTALGLSHKARGAMAEARRCLERVVMLAPDDPTAPFALAAIDGEHVSHVPAEVVEELFDASAEDYDALLVEGLGYRAPTLIAEALDGDLGRVLDLGCGTGLCGVALGARATRLVGVDLSDRMLRRAAQRAIYDELHHAEIGAWLSGDGRRWDLIVAGDVLGYVGDLGPLLRAVAPRLAPRGRFVATTEVHPGEGYVLRSTGRFAHGGSTVDAWARAAGLHPQARRVAMLRHQHGEPVEGEIHLLSRAP